MNRVESFRKYLSFERRYSEHTIRSYLNDINQFQIYIRAHVGINEEEELSHHHVRSWIVHLMTEGYTAKSVNRKISTLKSYFKYLKKLGEIKNNPTSKVIAPKIAKRLPAVIREEELSRLLTKECDQSDFGSMRDSLVIELLYNTGIRRSELVELKIRDLNPALRQIKVLGKGNKERIIPVSVSLLRVINRYLLFREENNLDHSDYMIITDRGNKVYPKFIYNIVHRQLSQVSTSKKKSPHILRHSFATHMADQGAELNAIKELLGHSNLSATELYMHNSIERLRSVYEKAHPKS